MERVSHDSDRDFFMTPEQALEYGIVDHVIGRAKEPVANGTANGAPSGGSDSGTKSEPAPSRKVGEADGSAQASNLAADESK
jgi:hypothetical protein